MKLSIFGYVFHMSFIRFMFPSLLLLLLFSWFIMLIHTPSRAWLYCRGRVNQQMYAYCDICGKFRQCPLCSVSFTTLE